MLKAVLFKEYLNFIPVERMGNLLKIPVSSSNRIFLLFKNVSFKEYLQHHEILTFDLDIQQQLPVGYGRRVRENCKLEQKKERWSRHRAVLGFLGFGVWFFMLIFSTDDNDISFYIYQLDFASSPQKFGHNPVCGELFFSRKCNHSLKNFSSLGFSRLRHFQVSDTITTLL